MATIASYAPSDVVIPSSDLPVEVTSMQAMASKMWVPFIAMGFMIVVAAFIIGIVNSSVASGYFEATKEAREAAVAGSDLATDKAFIESVKAWLPPLKFLGMGMLLGGVTFLLATILGALRVGGGRVQEALGTGVKLIEQPMTAKVFPMVMMMVLMIAVVVGIVDGFLTYDYWNHSIATELNPAEAGSSLLSDLGTISSIKLWLEPLKFVGLAMVLTAIGLALATIVRILRWQANRLWDVLS